jgi:hypothetical protein
MTDRPPPVPHGVVVDRIEAALAVVLVAIAAASFAGLVVAETGLFTRTILTLTTAVLLAIAAIAGRAVLRSDGLRVRRTPLGDWFALALVVGVASFAFRPPVDAEVDAADASVYLATGRLIVADGGLRRPVTVLSGLTPETVEGLFVRDRLPPRLLNYFPGGIQLSDDGVVEPGFFHLAPVWVAIWTTWFGDGPLWLNPIFGVLAIAFVWGAARRLWSTATASLVGLMLIANFAQIWFARIPVSEGIAETFVVAALAALTVALAESSATAAVLAGVAAGLSAFCRIDAMALVAVPLAGLAAFMLFTRTGPVRPMKWFLVSLLVVSTYAAGHLAIFAEAYIQRVYYMVFKVNWKGAAQLRATLPVGIVAVVALGVVALVLRRKAGGVASGMGAIGALRVPVAVVAVAVVLASVFIGWRAGNAFVMLVTPGIALLMGLGLVAAVATNARLAMPAAIVFVVSAVVYLPSPLDRTGVPMMLRRFVPVLLPVGMVLAGGAFDFVRRWAPGRLLVIPIAALSTLAMTVDSRVLFAATPYAGVRDELARIVGAIPANALVFVDPVTPSHFALALSTTFSRTSLLVTAPDPAGAVRRVVDEARAAGRPVRIVAAPEQVASRVWGPEAFRGLALRPLGLFPLDYVVLRSANDRLPVSPLPVSRSIAVYDVIDPPHERAMMPLRVDVGPLDLEWWPDGVHGPEMMQGATARWTNGDARFTLPPVDVDPARPLRLRFRLAAERPAGFARPSVELVFDDTPVGTFVATQPGFGEYEVAVPQPLVDRFRAGGVLGVRSDTFVPADHERSDDRRQLGVALDWMTVDGGS